MAGSEPNSPMEFQVPWTLILIQGLSLVRECGKYEASNSSRDYVLQVSSQFLYLSRYCRFFQLVHLAGNGSIIDRTLSFHSHEEQLDEHGTSSLAQ